MCNVSVQKRPKIVQNVDMTAFTKISSENPTSLLTQNFVFFALRGMWDLFYWRQKSFDEVVMSTIILLAMD